VKVKLFVRDKSMIGGWGGFLAALEDEVNAWLAVHPEIRIVHVTQSSNGGSFDTSKVFLSIWYEEGAAPPDVVDRPGSSAFPAGGFASRPGS
jgi:hypothetical protein